jgi:hypothetical protein
MTFMISTFRRFANGTKVTTLSKLFRDSIRSKLLETRKKLATEVTVKNLMKELPDNQLVSSQDDYFETIVVLAKFFPTK